MTSGPQNEKAYLKRLKSNDLQVILTPKDAVTFPTRELAELMNNLDLKGSGKVEKLAKANDYTPYSIVKYASDGILFLHYSDMEGYNFKVGMRGACIFQEYQADMFLESMFAKDGKVVKRELIVGNKLDIVTKKTQTETDLFVKNAKKRAKKTHQKAKARLKEASQGVKIVTVQASI